MNEERKIQVEQVDAVTPPPKARVDDPASPRETFERKRDYLEGFLSKQPEAVGAGEPGGALHDAIVEALKEIYDPEIPVNIYELGLIYEINVDADRRVGVRMTLTSPACPSAQQLPSEVRYKVKALEGVTDCAVDVIWEPPWTKEMMSEAAKLSLGLF